MRHRASWLVPLLVLPAACADPEPTDLEGRWTSTQGGPACASVLDVTYDAGELLGRDASTAKVRLSFQGINQRTPLYNSDFGTAGGSYVVFDGVELVHHDVSCSGFTSFVWNCREQPSYTLEVLAEDRIRYTRHRSSSVPCEWLRQPAPRTE